MPADSPLTIEKMVYNRLPNLTNNSANSTLIDDFILEVCWELEPCFNISVLTDGTIDQTRIGIDTNYSIDQKAVVADLTTVSMLLWIVLNNIQASQDGTNIPVTKFLKRAKAGSADVEYEQLNIKESSILALNADSMIDRYKKSAERKARSLGCIIDIADDPLVLKGLMQPGMPLITVTSCGFNY